MTVNGTAVSFDTFMNGTSELYPVCTYAREPARAEMVDCSMTVAHTIQRSSTPGECEVEAVETVGPAEQ